MCITSIFTGWSEPEEVALLGLDEMFDRGAVMLVEWGEAYKHVLPRTTSSGDSNTSGQR